MPEQLWIVVLIKDFSTAKSRLSPAMRPEQRRALAEQRRVLGNRHLILRVLRVTRAKGALDQLPSQRHQLERRLDGRIHIEIAGVQPLPPLIVGMSRIKVNICHGVTAPPIEGSFGLPWVVRGWSILA